MWDGHLRLAYFFGIGEVCLMISSAINSAAKFKKEEKWHRQMFHQSECSDSYKYDIR